MSRTLSCRCLIAAATVLATASVGHAQLYIQGLGSNQGVSSPRYDRFYTGADKAFIGQAYDWSGVGQASDGTWATMISPTYFISAEHWHPSGGDTVTFYGDNTTNDPHSYTVDSWSASIGDFFLGRLTAPIPASDHIAYYPILNLPTDSQYVGREIFVEGKPWQVGRNIISGVSRRPHRPTMSFTYNTYGNGDSLGDDEAYLVGGDSGGPSFTVSAGGALTVIGTHSGNSGSPPPSNGSVSTDTFVPDEINWLNSQMVGEQATVITPGAVTATWQGGTNVWTDGDSNNWTSGGGAHTWANSQEAAAIFSASPNNQITISGTVVAYGLTFSSGATGYTLLRRFADLNRRRNQRQRVGDYHRSCDDRHAADLDRC